MGVADFDIFEREMYNVDHVAKGTCVIRDLDPTKLCQAREDHDPMAYYKLLDECKDIGGEVQQVAKR